MKRIAKALLRYFCAFYCIAAAFSPDSFKYAWAYLLIFALLLIPEIKMAVRYFKNKKEKAAQEEAARQREAAAAEKAQQQEAEFNAFCADMRDYEIQAVENPAENLYYDWIEDLKLSWPSVKQLYEHAGNYIALDTETTGLSAADSEIIQIAAIRFENFRPIERFVTYCKPLKGLNANAAKVNGITREDVDDKPTFGQVAKSLEEFLGESAIVGHNVRFDLKFIEKYGVDLRAQKHKYYDTYAISKTYARRYKGYVFENYKLGTLCAALDIYHGHQHDAEGDAMAAGMLFAYWVKKFFDEI